jgi:hypothetical protein
MPSPCAYRTGTCVRFSRPPPRVSWQRHFRTQLIEIKGDDLTKARSPAVIKHDITTDLELQAVQRSLKRELAPIK